MDTADATNPSTLAHVGTAYERHRLLWALQKNPVSDVQSTFPHLQTPPFSVTPDVSAQDVVVWLQVVVLATHTMPVSEEHSLPVPQTQVGEEVCGLDPSWGLQAAAVDAHRQE